jgi:hypothetical protein
MLGDYAMFLRGSTFVLVLALVGVFGSGQVLGQGGKEIRITGTVKSLYGDVLDTDGLNAYLIKAGVAQNPIVTPEEHERDFDISVTTRGKNTIVSKSFNPKNGKYEVKLRLDDVENQVVTIKFNFPRLEEAVLGNLSLESQTINVIMPVVKVAEPCVYVVCPKRCFHFSRRR